jgi:hypothetical protein
VRTWNLNWKFHVECLFGFNPKQLFLNNSPQSGPPLVNLCQAVVQ